MHQNRSHHHHGTAEGRFTAKKWFGHRAGRSPCAHSIGKFFLCYIVLFSSETSAPGSPGNYLYSTSPAWSLLAYEGKGRFQDPASHRGCASVLGGTAARSSCREVMLPSYFAFTGPQYVSAQDAANVGQAGMKQFWKAGGNESRNCAMIFLDIQAAHYSVCSKIALGFGGSDSHITRILQFFRLPPRHMHDLHRIREHLGAMEEADSGNFHRQMLTEMSSCTWYTVLGSATVTRTLGGSRPGDGLADMIFGYCVWTASPWATS